MSTRDQMLKALRDTVMPRLRERGFLGSLPRLRRSGADHMDLLEFQFDRWGGGFVIEVGCCSPDGVTMPWGERIPPNRVRTAHLPLDRRARVSPGRRDGVESWFRYDSAEAPEAFAQVAQSVLPFLDQAENALRKLPKR